MNDKLKTLCTLTLVTAVVAGCATVPQEAGFGEVRNAMAQRTNLRVHWNQGTPEDQAVAKSVRALLAEPLTAETVVQIALLNNARLQATYEELGIAQAALVQAGLLDNPFFEGVAVFPLAGGKPDLELSLVQEFLSILYLPLRQRIAAAEFEAAKHRVTGEVLDLAGRTQASFYRMLADEQMLELRQQVVKATSASFDAIQRLREAGNVTALDVDNERALYEQARLDLARAEAAVFEGREELNQMMGLWGADVEWTAAAHRLPDLPSEPLDLAEFESRAVEFNLDLAAARQELIGLGERLGMVKATALVSDLELGVTSEREEGEWEVGPVLGLPIPLFDQGQARIAAAYAKLRRRQQAYAASAVELRSAARAARQRYLMARDLARHYQQVMLPLRTRIVQQNQLQYNAMQVGVFQLLLARQQQIDTAQRYVESLRDYWLARTEAEQLLRGHRTDLGGAVAEPMAAAPAGAGGSPH